MLAFSPPVFRFYTKSDWESFTSFQNAFRNKEREQKNYISCVFKHTFACNSLRDTVRSEVWKHMPCYVHRTQILNLTSAKGNSGATFRQLVDNWSGGSGGLHPTSPFLCRQPKREPKNIYTDAVIFCQTARVSFWFLGCLDRSHHYCNKWFHWFKRVEYFPVVLAHRWG